MPDDNARAEALLQAVIDRRLLTEEQAESVRAAAETDETPIFHAVKLGLLRTSDLTEVLSDFYEVPAIDLADVFPEMKLAELIDSDTAARFRVLPLESNGSVLRVAIADPTNLDAVTMLGYMTEMEIKVLVADPYTITQRIDRLYSESDTTFDDALERMKETYSDKLAAEQDWAEDELQAESGPVIDMIDGILRDAVRRRASDIHIEPFEEFIKVRYRIDGTLHEAKQRIPKPFAKPLVARIKILSELDIAEKRLPQDGRLRLAVNKRPIDFRVSTLPVRWGEKVVLRILDKGSVSLDLNRLGIEERAKNVIETALNKPFGMMLVTGPTGSGKSTTLYSALNFLDKEKTNISTAEDPVEYEIDGINQVPVQEEIGYTFEKALRAFLRQDPDVIMVGEMRDLITASIALKAALTGHLVISTLHTNDAASAFARLTDMGVEAFHVANAMLCVIAQRLVRRICRSCSKPHPYTEAEMFSIGVTPEMLAGDAAALKTVGLTPENFSGIDLRKGEGCMECDGIGYRGRMGLYEVIQVDAKLRRLILEEKPADVILKQAQESGTLTLRQIGIQKVLLGHTTPQEVLRATTVY